MVATTMDRLRMDSFASLRDAVAERRVTFFFGAGASHSANLPLGDSAAMWLLESLANNLGVEKWIEPFFDRAQNGARGLRFEKMVSQLVELAGSDAIEMLNVFDAARPTVAHRFIARAAHEGLVREH